MKTQSIMKIFCSIIVSVFAISTGLAGNVLARAPQVGDINQAVQPTPTLSPTAVPTSVQPKFSTKNVTLTDLGYSKDETVQGILASRLYEIRWPGSWDVKPGNSVTIQFSHPLNLASYSSLAVDFNSVRIGSVSLTPENADNGRLKLDIPANIINAGYNELALHFYMGIHDNYCDDIQNPGVWATIHSASAFDLSYDNATLAPELGLFPVPLLQKSNLLINQLSIVTADNPSVSELKAVAVISAKLGQLNSFYNMNLVVVPESAMSSPASVKGNKIFIGLSKNLKVLTSGAYPFVKSVGGKLDFVSLDGKTLNPDDGILWEDVSPTDPTSVRLIVTGQTDAGLEKAAQGLANDSIYVRLKGQLGVIQQIPQTLPIVPARKSMTLANLGYKDQTAGGTSKQTITYVLPLTGEWKVATEATFNLHFGHSALLYSQGSVVSLLVNDIPVGSDLLTTDNAENGNLTYKIPARLFKIGNNTLSFQTDGQLPYDPQDKYFCDKDHFYESWVTVYSDSSLTLPDGPTSLVLDLENYPAGFSGITDLSDLGFVVADSPDWTTAQAIAWIATRLGRYSPSPDFNPNVIKASDYKNDSTIVYQILIGEPGKNKAISQLNAILPLPFAEGKNTLQNPQQIAQIVSPTGSGSIGYIQAAITDKDKPRLVVTGNSAEGVLWAAKALNDQDKVDQLKGDFAILDSPVSIYSASIKDPIVAEVDATPVAGVVTPIRTITGISTTWVLWLAGGLFLLTLLMIIIFTVFTLRNKNK